eukprot:1161493-Pelagomonas_calceolata.AAC.6
MPVNKSRASHRQNQLTGGLLSKVLKAACKASATYVKCLCTSKKKFVSIPNFLARTKPKGPTHILQNSHALEHHIQLSKDQSPAACWQIWEVLCDGDFTAIALPP